MHQRAVKIAEFWMKQKERTKHLVWGKGSSSMTTRDLYFGNPQDVQLWWTPTQREAVGPMAK